MAGGLEYDNSAFYYFALSCLSIYLAPAWIYIFNKLYNRNKDTAVGAGVARTSLEKKKADAINKEGRSE